MEFKIIPQPSEITVFSSESAFFFSDETQISCPDEFSRALDDLVLFSQKVFSINLLGGGKEKIVFSKSDEIKNKEGYKISVKNNNIFIFASDGAGAFYAVQTLKQLLLQGKNNLPEMEIFDLPQCAWRGFMLDSARYFFSVEAVKLFLDSMALHKLNCFHWHLTDDQGWRIELYNKLLLAQIGSHRSCTNFGKTPHEGYYSKEDIEEIVSYASEKYISIIPEIDSPGHVVSAIAAYPELSCFNRELEVETKWGIKNDVLCVGKEETYDFMFEILDEICEMFPSKIIHIGGDEVPTVRWKLCPHCQKKMKELGFENESQLHGYYLSRIASYLEKKGFLVIMWDSKNLDHSVSKSVIRQFWSSDEAGKIESRGDFKLINSSTDAFYLDYPYGHTNLKKCYEAEINLYSDNCLGGEACLWTEYVPSMKKAGYCLFPRLAAFSERVWCKRENLSYENFVSKIPQYKKLLDTLPFDYASMKQAMPSFFRKHCYNLWFERRRLHWGSLHNTIDNFKVKKLSKKEKTND
ncbi:MAG: beta-N-acetylhexosaminidase [Clostridia bacterium]|nr:beta-N-acetylhexosaminidase [Clostridia bacterium]